jgi:hypothetical protein
LHLHKAGVTGHLCQMPDRSRKSPKASPPKIDEALLELLRAAQDDGKNLAAVSLGRRGGLKGGRARAEKLSATERSDIARLAAQRRWEKNRDG